MGKQLHKRFSVQEVVDIFQRYQRVDIREEQAVALLKISRRRFFQLLRQYRQAPNAFSLEYKRNTANYKMDPNVEKKILRELKQEKKLIEDRDNPIRNYNYSYIQQLLERKYEIKISLPTIIDRAKKKGFTKRGEKRSLMTEKF